MVVAEDSVAIVRRAFEAFLAGDIQGLRESVDSELEWTFLDPSFADPTPATCHGRAELEKAVEKWAAWGSLRSWRRSLPSKTGSRRVACAWP